MMCESITKNRKTSRHTYFPKSVFVLKAYLTIQFHICPMMKVVSWRSTCLSTVEWLETLTKLQAFSFLPGRVYHECDIDPSLTSKPLIDIIKCSKWRAGCVFKHLYVLCPMAYVCPYSCEHDNDFIKCSEHCQRQAIIWGQQYRSCGDCHLIDWDNEEPPLCLCNRRPDLIRIMQYTLVKMSCWLTFTSALITATDPISQTIIIFHCTILVWLGERFISLGQWMVKNRGLD